MNISIGISGVGGRPPARPPVCVPRILPVDDRHFGCFFFVWKMKMRALEVGREDGGAPMMTVVCCRTRIAVEQEKSFIITFQSVVTAPSFFRVSTGAKWKKKASAGV